MDGEEWICIDYNEEKVMSRDNLCKQCRVVEERLQPPS